MLYKEKKRQSLKEIMVHKQERRKKSLRVKSNKEKGKKFRKCNIKKKIERKRKIL